MKFHNYWSKFSYNMIIFCLVWGRTIPMRVAYLNIMHLQIVQVVTHHHLLVCIPLIRSWASTRATWSLGKNIADSWPDAACRLALDYTYFKRIPTVFGCFWHVCFYSKSICKNHQRYILHVFVHLFYIFQIEPFCVFSRAMDCAGVSTHQTSNIYEYLP